MLRDLTPIEKGLAGTPLSAIPIDITLATQHEDDPQVVGLERFKTFLVEEDEVVCDRPLNEERSIPPSDTFCRYPSCLMTQKKLDKLNKDFDVDDNV